MKISFAGLGDWVLWLAGVVAGGVAIYAGVYLLNHGGSQIPLQHGLGIFFIGCGIAIAIATWTGIERKQRLEGILRLLAARESASSEGDFREMDQAELSDIEWWVERSVVPHFGLKADD